MGLLIRLPVVGSLCVRLAAKRRAPRSLSERAPALPRVASAQTWRHYQQRGRHLRALAAAAQVG